MDNKTDSFFGIGIENGKTRFNYGTLFRTATIFNADFLFTIGRRFDRQNSDTVQSWTRLPVFSYKDFDDFNSHRPYSCKLIGVELDDKSIPLSEFVHPKQAVYILGAEDHGLTSKARLACQEIVELPGSECLNVSVAGSIVLYDRVSNVVH